MRCFLTQLDRIAEQSRNRAVRACEQSISLLPHLLAKLSRLFMNARVKEWFALTAIKFTNTNELASFRLTMRTPTRTTTSTASVFISRINSISFSNAIVAMPIRWRALRVLNRVRAWDMRMRDSVRRHLLSKDQIGFFFHFLFVSYRFAVRAPFLMLSLMTVNGTHTRTHTAWVRSFNLLFLPNHWILTNGNVRPPNRTHSHIVAAAFSKTPVGCECNWQI